MSLFTSGIVSDFMKSIFGVVDDLHTSEEEKAEMKFRISALAKSLDLAQIEVNKEEAKSGLIFVSGWRPFVGWTCGAALAWTFVVSPIFQSIAFYIAQFTGRVIDLSGLPMFDLSVMMPVLLGMLGLGTMRTYEKVNGAARVSLGQPLNMGAPAVPGKEKAQRSVKDAFATDTRRMRKGKPRGD